MGKLTQYIGGQTVTDSGGTGERQFVRSDNAIDDTTGFVVGNIYLTPTEITNSVELTGIAFTNTSNTGTGATNRTVRVSGNPGAAFTLSYGGGASGDTGVQTIPESNDEIAFNDTTVAIPAQTDTSVDTFTVTLNLATSDPETEFSDALIADTDLQSTSIQNTALLDGSGIISFVSFNTGGGINTGSNSFNVSVSSGSSSQRNISVVIAGAFGIGYTATYAQNVLNAGFTPVSVTGSSSGGTGTNDQFQFQVNGNVGTTASPFSLVFSRSGYTPQTIQIANSITIV